MLDPRLPMTGRCILCSQPQMERIDCETLCLRRQEGMKSLRKHKGGTEEAKRQPEKARERKRVDCRPRESRSKQETGALELGADEETRETEKSGFLRAEGGGGGSLYMGHWV